MFIIWWKQLSGYKNPLYFMPAILIIRIITFSPDFQTASTLLIDISVICAEFLIASQTVVLGGWNMFPSLTASWPHDTLHTGITFPCVWEGVITIIITIFTAAGTWPASPTWFRFWSTSAAHPEPQIFIIWDISTTHYHTTHWTLLEKLFQMLQLVL